MHLVDSGVVKKLLKLLIKRCDIQKLDKKWNKLRISYVQSSEESLEKLVTSIFGSQRNSDSFCYILESLF